MPASQTPPEHVMPVAQAGPEPHLHSPFVQALAMPVHERQEPPSLPQAATDPVSTHVPPWQQPPAQEAGVHWQLPITHA
jgi:hypothetical protein